MQYLYFLSILKQHFNICNVLNKNISPTSKKTSPTSAAVGVPYRKAGFLGLLCSNLSQLGRSGMCRTDALNCILS